MGSQQLAISKLANSMRIYAESNHNFNSLKHIDLEEAVNNLDRAFEAKLEAFHSLYDVDKSGFNYFGNADTAFFILLRNAIHHRDHSLFTSWNSEMALNGGLQKNAGAQFLLAAHEVLDAPYIARQYYKLEDFFLRIDPVLKSPFLEKKMGEENRRQLLEKFKIDLGFDEIIKHATDNRYPRNQIYLNIIPIFISAMCRIFKSLKSRGASFTGFDAVTYERLFTGELGVDMSKISYGAIRIS